MGITKLKPSSLLDASRWGLPYETVEIIGKRLYSFWLRYHDYFVIRGHDQSEKALVYLKGLLLMNENRNYANIARTIISPESDGQDIQHFMSESPWSVKKIFVQLQTEIKDDPRLQEDILTLDESGTPRYGSQIAGVGRQYLGSMGKVDNGQVGVVLGYYSSDTCTWAMVDAELFFPEKWFDEEHQKEFDRLHIPTDLVFKTKLEIGLELIDKAIANGLPFSCVTADDLYGRSHDFRSELDGKGVNYIVDVPCDLEVYQEKPETGIPQRTSNRGRKPTQKRVLNNVKPIEVRKIVPELTFEAIEVRDSERGKLIYQCAKTSVWTITSDGDVRREQLFVRRESDGTVTYSLSNASDETPLQLLAEWRAGRFFAERIFEDSKSELGWDELEAQKYRAWMHHTVFDALALWFIAQVKLDWADEHPRDLTMADELEIEKLPQLSVANVRLLLQAVMPLKQFTIAQAIAVVIKHLVNRAKSTQSRLKKQKERAPT